MSDLNSDPPKTLREGEQQFRVLLRHENYPETIRWLIPGDVVVSKGRRYWVRKRGTEAEQYAAARYADGVERGLGILLSAVCATKAETFAWVFVPEDRLDAGYHLLGRCLRVACPVDGHSTTVVTGPLHWLWLRRLYGKQSDLLEVNHRMRP